MKFMDPADLRKQGYMQEANRVFFHPLGLALGITQSGQLVIIDGRADPLGWWFDDDIINNSDTHEKAARVSTEFARRADRRREQLGYVVQPVARAREEQPTPFFTRSWARFGNPDSGIENPEC